jgi:hypothetical protein
MFWVVACLVILVIVYFLFIKKAPVTHVDPKGKCVLVTGMYSPIYLFVSLAIGIPLINLEHWRHSIPEFWAKLFFKSQSDAYHPHL